MLKDEGVWYCKEYHNEQHIFSSEEKAKLWCYRILEQEDYDDFIERFQIIDQVDEFSAYYEGNFVVSAERFELE